MESRRIRFIVYIYIYEDFFNIKCYFRRGGCFIFEFYKVLDFRMIYKVFYFEKIKSIV